MENTEISFENDFCEKLSFDNKSYLKKNYVNEKEMFENIEENEIIPHIREKENSVNSDYAIY